MGCTLQLLFHLTTTYCHWKKRARAQELCESRGGRPGLPSPNKPTVSVDVKQHFNNKKKRKGGGGGGGNKRGQNDQKT